MLIRFFESNPMQIFNLKSDPGGKNDFASTNPEKAEVLLQEIKQWQKQAGAVIPSRLNPDFSPKAKCSTRKSGKKRVRNKSGSSKEAS